MPPLRERVLRPEAAARVGQVRGEGAHEGRGGEEAGRVRCVGEGDELCAARGQSQAGSSVEGE